MINYPVDVGSLHEHFPPHFAVPGLLLEFADWLKDKTWGSVGCFRLESKRFNEFWMEEGLDLHSFFAFFIRDPTGGQVGFWLHEGCDIESPPVVLVGSEGELAILGNSLPEFLARLAKKKTQASDLDSRAGQVDKGTQLAKWLKTHSAGLPAPRHRSLPDFQQWFEQLDQQQRDWVHNDPLHRKIADKLRMYVKPNAEPWETANFDVLLVGTQFRMSHSNRPQAMPAKEVAGFESLFRAVREERARKFPDRGLWFTARVTVGAEGGAYIACNFMDEPKIPDDQPPIPASDYKLDLKAFPRSKHWTPKWLEHRL